MTEIKAPLIIEEPDGKVKREALFYCIIGDVLEKHLQFDKVSPFEYLPPVGDASWLPRPVGAQFEEIPLPKAVGTGWQHLYLKTPEEELTKYCSRELRLVRDYVADDVPDFTAWPPFQIVSARAREVLEELFPGRSSFLDLTITKSTGEPVAGEFFYWVVRDRFFFMKKHHNLRHDREELPFPGPFATFDYGWQFQHNIALRDYLKQLPYWGVRSSMMYAAFNAPTFTRLREEHFTGLVESFATHPADRKLHESIGHVPLKIQTEPASPSPSGGRLDWLSRLWKPRKS